ncbi:MAG: hypothetical protein ACRETG_11560, partial [Steroidobacteraceae bacterium]
TVDPAALDNHPPVDSPAAIARHIYESLRRGIGASLERDRSRQRQLLVNSPSAVSFSVTSRMMARFGMPSCCACSRRGSPFDFLVSEALVEFRIRGLKICEPPHLAMCDETSKLAPFFVQIPYDDLSVAISI